jgi:lipopolysaccharide/colanic/teichoic acid biosynthesis glycosyltransferase
MATQRRTLTERRSSLVDHEAGVVALNAESVFDPNVVIRRLRQEALTGRPYYDFSKRALDIVVAALALFALLPVLAVVALMIRLDSRGPVFFCQERLGKGTRRFTMIKFRSMRTDRSLTPEELAARNEATGPLFKIKNDPRITTTGRFLRKTSIDELPQLINVLRGEMSIVGPRPPLPRELAGFENIQQQRLRVKPGLAGLWQVSGRSFLTFDEMVGLDLEYIEKRGFIYDITLILRTIPAVLLGRGAY